ncbi:T9SS type A sorting domain-containing protein [Faecalibacter bovis]|uniref:T9SS type A sorting domain-containing protein n=1 Tax=Faecalibacter bovis TaxID=2898187 RepID=A0ABX7XAH9_9FLAO|nr:T9SS type A sorting domain-containing protein [Faecalibacter bovis]QTV04802.1 T9SS type A sorting domain-containing protein [Faecalibacter bovis]
MKKLRHLTMRIFGLILMLISTVVFGQHVADISAFDAYYKLSSTEVIDVSGEYIIASFDSSKPDVSLNSDGSIKGALMNSESSGRFGWDGLNFENGNLYKSNINGLNDFVHAVYNRKSVRWKFIKNNSNFRIQNISNNRYLYTRDNWGSYGIKAGATEEDWKITSNKIYSTKLNQRPLVYSTRAGGTDFFVDKYLLSGNSNANSNTDIFKRLTLDNVYSQVGYVLDRKLFPAKNSTGANITYEVVKTTRNGVQINETLITEMSRNEQFVDFRYDADGVVELKAIVDRQGHIPSYTKTIFITIKNDQPCFMEGFENQSFQGGYDSNVTLSNIDFPNFPNLSNGNNIYKYFSGIILGSNANKKAHITSRTLSELSGKVTVEMLVKSDVADKQIRIGFISKSKVLGSTTTISNSTFYNSEVVNYKVDKTINDSEYTKLYHIFDLKESGIPQDLVFYIGTHNSDTRMYINEVKINCSSYNNTDTTWDYGFWSHGKPNKNRNAIVRQQTTESFEAKEILVERRLNSNDKLNILVTNNDTYTAYSKLTVDPRDELIFDKGSYLYLDRISAGESSAATVSGNVGFKSKINYFNYESNIYSSPVIGQLIKGNGNTYFTPNGTIYRFDTESFSWKNYTGNVFEDGKGVMIQRTGATKYYSNYDSDNDPNTVNRPLNFEGIFKGVPNQHKTIRVSLTPSINEGSYMIGNPYSAPISIKSFLSYNTNIDFIEIMTNENPWDYSTGKYLQPKYYTYCNSEGCTNSNNDTDTALDLKLDLGVGFLAKTKSNIENFYVNFRYLDIVKSIDKNDLLENNRQYNKEGLKFTLGLIVDNKEAASFLMSFNPNASNEFEEGMDARISNKEFEFFSLNNGNKYVIESRFYPLDVEDYIVISFRTSKSGSHIVYLKNIINYFDLNQKIFLKDNYENKIIDLTNDMFYEFNSEVGEFTDRFEIIFKNDLLEIEEFSSNEKLVIYESDNNKYINSNDIISSYDIFNIQGVKIDSHTNINSKSVKIIDIPNKGFYLLKIYLQNGKVVNRKILNK